MDLNNRIICLSLCDVCVHTLPRPLMPLVSKWDINHSHQSFLEKSAIILSIVLLEHLTATISTHWENQTPSWL